MVSKLIESENHMAPNMQSYLDFIANTNRECAIVSHRGAWHSAPENSLLAIEKAIQSGCKVVEIDVRRSLDGEFFLLHDETLERMADINKRPEELTSAELSNITLRNRDGGKTNAFTNEKMPSLTDVFKVTRNRIFIHLDIKHKELLPDVMACARALGVDQQVDYWGDLNTRADLDWIHKKVNPHNVLFMAKTHLEANDANAQLELLFELHPPLCEIYFNNLEQLQKQKERYKNAGIALWVNTLDAVSCAGFTDSAALKDPEGIWGSLIDAGISIIQTDEVEALQKFINGRATRLKQNTVA